MTSTEPALRRAGRVLVIDPAGRVLLLEGFDPAEPGSPFWFTIGGGLDEGEHSAQAALRELREEAGIVAAAISSRARSGGAAPNPDGHQQPPPGYQPYSPQQGYQRPGQMPWPGPQQARPARRSHTARNVLFSLAGAFVVLVAIGVAVSGGQTGSSDKPAGTTLNSAPAVGVRHPIAGHTPQPRQGRSGRT